MPHFETLDASAAIAARRALDVAEDAYEAALILAYGRLHATAAKRDPRRAAATPQLRAARAAVQAAKTSWNACLGLGAEPVTLADGEAVQALVPGVEPLSATARAAAQLRVARATRRGSAPPPAGGLFDEAARAQGELF